MKARISKLIAILLALTVFVCCFTSCAGKKDNEEETSATKPSEIEAPSDELVDFNEYTLPSDETETTEEDATVAGESTTKNSSSTVEKTTKPNNNSNGNGNVEQSSNASSGLTRQDMVRLLNSAGYVYDEEQDMYYTHLNPWQRQFGFTGTYDTAASYFNMEYTTFKCDFTYKGKDWRIQCWKGQYALLCGAEMGVYTKTQVGS